MKKLEINSSFFLHISASRVCLSETWFSEKSESMKNSHFELDMALPEKMEDSEKWHCFPEEMFFHQGIYKLLLLHLPHRKIK